MAMVSPSDALIAVSDSILDRIDLLSRVEYNKKGRKYKFVNNNFQRIREEDKHLIVYPEALDEHLSVILAYLILRSIGNGEILHQYPDFCLSIVGVANELEENHWYEEENSSVMNYKASKFLYSEETKADALDFFDGVSAGHLDMGRTLLVCAKLNFLHTDHHIGTKVEGLYMKHFVSTYFGPDALNLPDVLVALKSFVHWGNIKGILHKLDVPNVSILEELKKAFETFPDPQEELKDNVYDRYPSGTSKYSLIRKLMDTVADLQFSRLIPYPENDDFGLDWIYALCHNIEHDPIRYHLRLAVKGLCEDPVNLNELSQSNSGRIKSLLLLIALVINVFPNTGAEFLLQNSKIPKFDDSLTENYASYYAQLVQIHSQIASYEEKGWDADDIVLRLHTPALEGRLLFDKVMEMREKYADDYE